MASGPRQRLLDSAVAMMRERGVHATGLADLLARSGTARNSIYQHFPSGKGELMVAATRQAAADSIGFLESLGARGDAEFVITKFIGWWVKQLQTHDFDISCPFAAATLSGPDAAQIRAAANGAFTGMRAAITTILRDSGVAEGLEPLSSVIVSAIEGALLQARAERSVTPLRDAEAELVALVRSRIRH